MPLTRAPRCGDEPPPVDLECTAIRCWRRRPARQDNGGPSCRTHDAPYSNRRSVYGFIERQNLPAFFRTFDFANPNNHTAACPQTTSPHQALLFMNSPFAMEQATHLRAGASQSPRLNPEPKGRAASLVTGSDLGTPQPHHRSPPRRTPLPLALGRKPTIDEFTDSHVRRPRRHCKPREAHRTQFGVAIRLGHVRLSDRTWSSHALPSPSATWKGGEAVPDAQLGWALLNIRRGPSRRRDARRHPPLYSPRERHASHRGLNCNTRLPKVTASSPCAVSTARGRRWRVARRQSHAG